MKDKLGFAKAFFYAQMAFAIQCWNRNSNTTGNVLNTFYGAITAGLANESSFENQGISIESENNKSEY